MEDESRAQDIIKLIRIVVMIIIIILIGLIVFKIVGTFKVKKVNNNLEEDGFKEITKNIYTKTVTDGDYSILYRYISDEDEFTKTAKLNSNELIEELDMMYENEEIVATYRYISPSCGISHKATYKNNKFNCTISNVTNNCPSQCNKLLKEVKEFNNEANKYIKKITS